MEEKITIKDLRQNLVGIKNEYEFALHEDDYGRCSVCRILYIIDEQNKLFEKIINYIETNGEQ